jgi:DNA-binding transcriptional regulator YiaG
LTIREARLNAGLTQAKMSEVFEIPKRTIENWEAGIRKPPAYVEKLVIRELERIATEENNK